MPRSIWKDGKKKCSTCKRWKPASEFGADASRWDKRESRCLTCNSARRRDQSAKFRQYWKGRDAYAEHATQEKPCERCNLLLPIRQFARDRCAADGLQRWCRSCAVREWQLRTYGVTPPPGTVCAICGSERRIVVDHNHETKVVRGFLCTPCNTGLGAFYEDAAIMRRAIRYLTKGGAQ